ncbi:MULTISPECIES: hypothetical protein [Olivibacter]|uniref:Integrase catalytic domain-containing protein n=1 Tax=Olivibacter jilunii TaxID=985016 RepID=A0ABW6AZC5_9SPHI
MQYHNNNRICLTYEEFVPAIMTESNYKYHKANKKITVHGYGGVGRVVLIEFESLPDKYRRSVIETYGNPYEYIAKEPILKLIDWDYKAESYYREYVLPSGGKLPAVDTDSNGKPIINYVKRYTQAANWLNMLARITEDKRALKRELNISMAAFWQTATELIVIKKINLPTNERRLKDKLEKYKGNGYETLIEKHKFGNSYRAKINDELSEAVLKAMLEVRNKHDDTVIADDYNKWAKENNYQPISPETVGYRRRMWASELMLSREGIAKTYNKLSKHIHRDRASAPLLLINSDDNNLDAYFINGKNKYYRPVLYVVIDAFNDYILGYAVGDVVTKELIYEAYRNAFAHVCEMTGGQYLWRQIQTDHWGISGKNTTELEQFYNSMGTFTPAGHKNARTKYVEASFGTIWHQELKKVFTDNYSGPNIQSKEKLNPDTLITSNFPDVSEAPSMIAKLIDNLRNTKRKGSEMTRQQEWINAFINSEKSKKKAISSETRLSLFGKQTKLPIAVSAAGIVFELNKTKRTYELSQRAIFDNIGKKVQVTYDPYNFDEILITDGNTYREVIPLFQNTKAALADQQEGDRARYNNLMAEKATLMDMIKEPLEARKAALERAKIDTESRINAGVLIKEISHKDTKVMGAIEAGASDADLENSIFDLY